MGDRANFGFKADDATPIIFLYGHWAGEGMMSNLANALEKARPRWSDHAYATRICVSQIVGESWGNETGWGLSVDRLCDNEHKIPVVNWEHGTVSLFEEGEWPEPLGAAIFTMPIEGFITRFGK